jgi:uncharacterized protein (DUF1501 family)
MSGKNRPSRRSVLEIGWRSLALAGVAGLPQVSRAAQPNGRILVCIYLTGGNDGNNLIVPLDRSQYQAYAAARGELAVPAADLLPIRAVKNPAQYGFHPSLAELQDLYNLGALAVVANVGSPLTADTRSRHELDSMAYLPGGHLTLEFAARRAGVTITNSGAAFTTGRGVSMVSMEGSPAGPRSQELARAANLVKLRTEFPNNGVGRALKDIAGLIQGASANGIRSPLFTTTMGGFDTHQAQGETQPTLFRNLSSAMAAFYQATQEMGISQDVTVFTDSEFGRSLQPNSSHGTDHGWGNHQIVMGAAVLGGDVYGQFPDIATAARDSSGGWVPTTSRDLYLATLANWAGVPHSELYRAFPRLNGTANLGFLA